MGYRTISQIIMVVLSVVVILTYLQPKFAEISVVQDQTASFKEAVDKAAQFNDLLRSLLGQIDDFSQNDLRALDVYLPNQIDGVAIARDLKNIVEGSGLVFNAVSFTEIDDESGLGTPLADDGFVAAEPGFIDPLSGDVADGPADEGSDEGLVSQQFTIEATGNYFQMKDLLRAIEASAYPLQLLSLEFSGQEEGDLLTINIVYETYALTSQL